MSKLIVLSGVFCVLALIYACGDNRASSTGNVSATNGPAQPTAAPTKDEMAVGRELYNKNCANCHKESGEGGPTVVDGRKMKPSNLTDDRRKKLSDDKYLDFMVKGIEDEGMPSFKDKMSEAEMREVVRYIRVELQKQPDNPPPATSKAPPKTANVGSANGPYK